MNLLLFSADDRCGERQVSVTGRRLRHLREILGAGVGDAVRVGELGGLAGLGRVTLMTEERALLDVTLDTPPPDKLPLRLVLALPRPKMLRRIVRAVAELGVGEMHLINARRVEKSYWQTPALAPPVLREYLVQGLEQARDTVLPVLHSHRLFRPFVEDELPGLLRGRRGLLADPGNWPDCPRQVAGDTLLVVGPEGGFIPYEVDKLREAGCEPVSLGQRVLRVETALTALLGRLF